MVFLGLSDSPAVLKQMSTLSVLTRSFGVYCLYPLGVDWDCGLCPFEGEGTICKIDVWLLGALGSFGPLPCSEQPISA